MRRRSRTFRARPACCREACMGRSATSTDCWRPPWPAACTTAVTGCANCSRGQARPLRGCEAIWSGSWNSCGTGPRHGCLMAKTALELAPEDTAVTAAVRRNFAGLRELLADAVRAAQVAGEISERWEPEAVAGSLLAIVEGFQVLGRTDPPEMLRGGSPSSCWRRCDDRGRRRVRVSCSGARQRRWLQRSDRSATVHGRSQMIELSHCARSS